MIKEIHYFLRHGPEVARAQADLSRVEFQKRLAAQADDDGYAELRRELVGDLTGDILEVGTGAGATLRYYREAAVVTAVEPDDEFRAAAEATAKTARARVKVVSGTGESLPFDDESFDAVTATTVLCSVASLEQTLSEFMRVLRAGGQLRLLEHVRSEHWLAGPLMNLSNPIWLRLNKVGCNMNRKPVEAVQDAGVAIVELKSAKVYTTAAPVAFPLRLIKGRRET